MRAGEGVCSARGVVVAVLFCYRCRLGARLSCSPALSLGWVDDSVVDFAAAVCRCRVIGVAALLGDFVAGVAVVTVVICCCPFFF